MYEFYCFLTWSRRKCTLRYDTFDPLFLTTVSPLTSRFPLIMAADGFGPYHRLWTDDAPSKPIGVTPTPWVMMPVLGLGISQVLASAYDIYYTALYLSVLFSSEKTLRKTINVHLLLTIIPWWLWCSRKKNNQPYFGEMMASVECNKLFPNNVGVWEDHQRRSSRKTTISLIFEEVVVFEEIMLTMTTIIIKEKLILININSNKS